MVNYLCVLVSTIGDKNENANVFDNYIGGVYALNSSCQLYNNEFDGNADDAVHVYALNDRFDLAGNPWPENSVIIGDGSPAGPAGNIFNNQVSHVSLNNVNAPIQGNTFNDATWAVVSNYSKYKSIGINDNKFHVWLVFFSPTTFCPVALNF